MPYYFGEDMPEWEAFFENDDVEPVIPPDVFKYVEPWAKDATVIAFPDVPGPELEEPVYTPTNFSEYFEKSQAFQSTQATNKISMLAKKCRELKVKRVLGSYQGGNDEGFTRFQGLVMADGRRIEPVDSLPDGIDFEGMIDAAVTALMGSWGAGPYELIGAVMIDIDASTITDEKDRDAVFAAKVAF
jgi:hypothetical protein